MDYPIIRMFCPLIAETVPGEVEEILKPNPGGEPRYIGQGERVEEFERLLSLAYDLQQDLNENLVVTTNSGTSAIDLALHMSDVREGDIVISTPITCTATNTPIVTRGARIVWCDVDPLTGIIDLERAYELARDKDAKSIIAVEWAGRQVDYSLFDTLAEEDDEFSTIVDIAHRGPTPLGGQFGEMPTYACASYQAIKFLTCGDGGALICEYPPDAARARKLRWYGLDRRSSVDFRCKQNITEAGYKYHMNDISASIGIANLDAARLAVYEQKKNASYLYGELSDIDRVTLPPFAENCDYWLFTILVNERDNFEGYMRANNIEVSRVHARNDLHAALNYFSRPRLNGVDQFDSRQISIPCGWWLTESDIERIANTIRKWATR